MARDEIALSALTRAAFFIRGWSSSMRPGLAAGILALCLLPAAQAQAESSINVLVTATAKIDGGIYAGTSVWNITLQRVPAIGYQTIKSPVRGEAVEIRPGKGQPIYVLRRYGLPSIEQSFWRACLPNKGDVLALLNVFKGPCDIGRPLAVTFADPENPSTVQRVSNDAECAKFCLLSVEMTRTDKPITTGLVKDLPWLSRGGEFSPIDPSETERPDQRVYNVDFSTEVDLSAK